MADQKEMFSVRGMSAEFVGKLQQDLDAIIVVHTGSSQLVYISPESILRNPQWREKILLDM